MYGVYLTFTCLTIETYTPMYANHQHRVIELACNFLSCAVTNSYHRYAENGHGYCCLNCDVIHMQTRGTCIQLFAYNEEVKIMNIN